jgi:hypothetical protein
MSGSGQRHPSLMDGIRAVRRKRQLAKEAVGAKEAVEARGKADGTKQQPSINSNKAVPKRQ